MTGAEFTKAGVTVTIDAEAVPRDVDEFHGEMLTLFKSVVGYHVTEIAVQEAHQ